MLRSTTIPQGQLLGIPGADPRITAYKGIPFAAPPVENLRWHAPKPPAPWHGVRDCSRFAPISMQETPGEDASAFYSREWHVDPAIAMNEDCLYLNIWTPAKTRDEKLPVMVWIFGGGMTCGYTAEMEFDGERMARRGVVLVSVNYRLNSFGFLAHPDLTREAQAAGEAPCNFGLLDQRAGIAWVKENIAAFGGDPDNITIFGQSAGGRSVWSHICSPMDKGLFQRAIVQSGGLTGEVARYPSLREAERRGLSFFEHLGVKTIEQARQLDASILLRKTLAWQGPRWSPVIDGAFLPRDPMDTIKLGQQNQICLMAGNTANEGAFRWGNDLPTFLAGAKHRWGKDFDHMMELLNIQSEEDIARYYASTAFNMFEVGNRFAAQYWARQQRSPVYLYRFNPSMPGDDAGSFHSSDLWFVFETLAKCWRPFTGKHYDLARHMCNYWTNFARSGNPNGLDADGSPMPQWQDAGVNGDRVMYFGDTPVMLPPTEDALLAFEIERNKAPHHIG